MQTTRPSFIRLVNFPDTFCFGRGMRSALVGIVGLVVVGIYFSWSLRAVPTQSRLPPFHLKDQRGKEVHSDSLSQKSVILIGCYPEDETVCRKVARKIYWKIQTFAYGKEDKIAVIGYLVLIGKTHEESAPILEILRRPGYESVFLDWNGELVPGVQRKKVLVRGYHPKRGLVFEEQWSTSDNDRVRTLYDLVSS